MIKSIEHLKEASKATLGYEVEESLISEAYIWLTRTRFQSPAFNPAARTFPPLLIAIMTKFRDSDEEQRNKIRRYFREEV